MNSKAMLTEKENVAANKFVWDHYAKHKKTAAATIAVIATGLGFHVTVKCPYCKKELDVTDTDSW